MKKIKTNKKEIFNEELESIKNIFYTNSDLKERLKMAISETWNIALEDIDDDVYGTIVTTYVNHLTKNNLEKCHEITNSSENSIILIQVDFISYLVHRKQFKNQRECLYELLSIMTDTERESYLLGKNGTKYDKKIEDVYDSLLNDKKYGYGELREEVVKVLGSADVIKHELIVFLCDNLVKYDFSTSLKDWCKKLAERFINSRPRVKLLLTGNERFITCFLNEISKELNYLVKRYNKNNIKMSIDENYSFTSIKEEVTDFGYSEDSSYDEYGIKPSVSYTYTKVDDTDVFDSLTEDLTVILKNKTILENYNYDSEFISYFCKIAERHLLKKISNPYPPTPRINKRKQKELEYIVTTKDNADYFNKVLKVLKLDGSKDYFGIKPKKKRVYDLQIMIIEEIYVNLTHFTRKEQKEKRENLKSTIPEFNKSDNNLRTCERRAREDLIRKKVGEKLQDLFNKVKAHPNGNLLNIEKQILSIFQIQVSQIVNLLTG